VQAGEIEELPEEFLEAARERRVERGVVSEVDPELDDD